MYNESTSKAQLFQELEGLKHELAAERRARQQAEEAQDRSELTRTARDNAAYISFLDSIMEQSPFAMWIADTGGTVIRTNQALREALNLNDSQIVGSYNVFQDSNLLEQGVMPQVQAVFSERTPARFNLLWTPRRAGDVDFSGGRELWIDVSIFPVQDPDGALLNVVCQWIDITQQTHAEAALREQEILFRTVFEQAAVGIAQVGPDGAFQQVNQCFCDMVGYMPQELVTKNFQDITHPDDLALDMRYIPQVLDGSIDTFDLEKRYLHKQGHTVWIHLYSSVVRDEHGAVTYSIAIITDEGERKMMEAEIRQLNTALEHRVRERTQELEAANKELEAFTYSVSHDLRTPLRGLDGFSLALLEDFADPLPSKAQHYLHRIRSAAQHMGHLIDDLLRLSRISRHELQIVRFDLSLLAEKIAAELSREQPERHVEYAIAPDLIVTADRNLIQHMLENLLRNAWKFTRLRTTARIELGCREEAGEQVFFLQDNGVGFDMRYAHKLFEAFQRLHDPKTFQGTGIGLAIVQRIIRRHGGRVWAESEVDQGTSIYFTLG